MDANGADEQLKCDLHGENEATGTCAECGKAFCNLEVEKSGQSVYCPDCYNATLDELLEGYERLKEGKQAEVSPSEPAAEPAAPVPAEAPPEPEPVKAADDPYFALGPDDDFSFFEKGGGKRRTPAGKPAKAPAEPEVPERPDEVLEDVVTALMGGAGHMPAKPAPQPQVKSKRGLRSPWRRKPIPAGESEAVRAVPATPVTVEDKEASEARVREAMELAREKALKRAEARVQREERWGFLAQPRAISETRLGKTRWRAALFIIVTGIVATLLWALPNALLIKGDTEYGLHAIAIGALVGLVLWWKAGKAHSTRLAFEAAAITLVGIVLGEMLHWTIIVAKEPFFRTVFDIISFKVFFTRLGTITGRIFPEMFPLNFLSILALPALVAFAIGFGSPPIPEIFGQMWRALRHGHSTEPENADGS